MGQRPLSLLTYLRPVGQDRLTEVAEYRIQMRFDGFANGFLILCGYRFDNRPMLFVSFIPARTDILNRHPDDLGLVI